MNSDSDDQQQHNDQASDNEVWEDVLAGVALVAVLPVMLGWVAAPLIARKPASWKLMRSLSLMPLLIVTAAEAWFCWAGGAQWLLSLITPLTLASAAAGVACWWLSLLPPSAALLHFRMHRIAVALDRGQMPPHLADPIRQAMWRAADDQAVHRSGWTLRDAVVALAEPTAIPTLILESGPK